MPTRYTAVFEWEGDAPAIGAGDGWLGGRLVRLSFEEEPVGDGESTLPLTNSELFEAIQRGLDDLRIQAAHRDLHEVVINDVVYRTTNKKLVGEIQRQDQEIQEMNGRLIAANRTLQNVRGQLDTAHRTIGDYRVASGALSDDEANEICKRLFQQYGPTTTGHVRGTVEAADALRAARIARQEPAGHMPLCPIGLPFFDRLKKKVLSAEDLQAENKVLEGEHRYLSSALIARCGARKIGETWVDYARRCMGQS